MIKLVNRTNEELHLELKPTERTDCGFIPDGKVVLQAKEVKDVNRLFQVDHKGAGDGKRETIKIGIYSGDQLLEVKETNFLYPRFINKEIKNEK